MGAWGYKAVECDKAQDWLLDLWEKYPILKEIDNALNRDVDAHHEEVRMAAKLVILLEHTCLIHPEHMARICEKAIRQLNAIKSSELYADEDFQAALQDEIDSLDRLTS